MSFKHIAFGIFNVARRIASASGLVRPIRSVLGPTTGKFLYRISAKSNSYAMVNGHQMYLATEGKYPPIRMVLGQYEEETTRVFERSIKEGMSILDIGAHVGYYSLLSAKLSGPTGKVFSFEPDPDNYSLLIRNIKANSYNTITPINKGVASASGKRTLYLSRLDNGRHSVYLQDSLQNGSVSITTTTMDDFFGALNWPTVDFVKIDVEGAELEVLNGMTGLLERCPKIKIIMELNPQLLKQGNTEPISLVQRLQSLGFSLKQISSENEAITLQVHEFEPIIQRLHAESDSINLFCVKT